MNPNSLFSKSYFDQAGEVSRLLNIKLASKAWGGHRVLMCGFPVVQINKYLKILVQQHNRFVAMCEEFMKDPLQGPAGGYNRRVVRIVTPGTLIDEPFLNPYENNYLLAIAPGEGPYSLAQTVGLAWIDVSTGDFFAKDSRLENIRDELARIAPREVVLDQNLPVESSLNSIRQVIIQEGFIVSYVNPSAEADVSYSVHGNAGQLNTDDLTSPDEPFPSAFSPHETAAVRLLTSFLNENLMEAMPKLSTPNKEVVEGRMQIDVHTVKALEIREGIREGGTTGSLLSVIKRTATSSGTRLLARWLCLCLFICSLTIF
jgi:DNA mismatch repair ATPase MutS